MSFDHLDCSYYAEWYASGMHVISMWGVIWPWNCKTCQQKTGDDWIVPEKNQQNYRWIPGNRSWGSNGQMSYSSSSSPSSWSSSILRHTLAISQNIAGIGLYATWRRSRSLACSQTIRGSCQKGGDSDQAAIRCMAVANESSPVSGLLQMFYDHSDVIPHQKRELIRNGWSSARETLQIHKLLWMGTDLSLSLSSVRFFS